MTTTPTILPYQAAFIDFLVASGALTFGDFVTKSGRKTPYFVNTGNFNDGSKISKLGSFYASHFIAQGLQKADVIFGPAYKGIPLCVSTASALANEHKLNVGFSFDRKEVKDHGDGGRIVGRLVKDGDKVVLVEDVITAGTTLKEIVPFLRAIGKVEILGVIIAVDRCEKGAGTLSAVQEAQENLGVSVRPIVNIHHIVAYLSQPNSSGYLLPVQLQNKIREYLEIYGAA